MNEELDFHFSIEPIVEAGKVREKVPEVGGVYLGYNETKRGNFMITYVGKSKTLRNRLHRHPKLCTHFSFEIIKEKTKRSKREKELIRKLSPSSNYQYNKDKKWRDYILIPLSNGKKLIGKELRSHHLPLPEEELSLRDTLIKKVLS